MLHSVDGGASWLASAAVDARAGEIPVLGLRVASTVRLKVEVTDGGDVVASAPITIQTDPPPAGTAPFRVDRWVPEQACGDGGYVLFSTLGQAGSGLGIVDRDGQYVWAFDNDADGTVIERVRPGRDGASVVWSVGDAVRRDDLAHVVRMNLDGSGRVDTRTRDGHDDFVELPDGRTIAWLGHDFADLGLPDLGTVDPDPVVAERLSEAAEGAAADDAVAVWSLLDGQDWPFGITVSGPEMERCPTVPGAESGPVPGFCEYAHATSLAYLPDDDAYLVLFRWLDALVKIDRASGRLRWVFGGDHDMFTGDDDDRFVHGHFSDAWKDDRGLLHVLVVDNHDAAPGDPQEDSRYAEFVLDESAMTFERTWMVPSDTFESALGDLRRVPIDGCDHLLISFSAQGRIVELTRDGEVVWDVALPLGNVTGRVTFLEDLYDLSGAGYP